MTIPERMLKQKGRITDPQLPVDAEVVSDFMINAGLEAAKPGVSNPADSRPGSADADRAGVARKVYAGLDNRAKINIRGRLRQALQKGHQRALWAPTSRRSNSDLASRASPIRW